MTLMDGEDFPDWNTYYAKNELKSMPWFSIELDEDVKESIAGLDKGNFLDLGTGPGTQAIELQKLGFIATGSDISEEAIKKASQIGEANFIVDDILDTKLPESGFDYILDRGCFHVFEKGDHHRYIKSLKKILKENGLFFLKCMSVKEKNLPEDAGPHKYSQQQIEEIFSTDFKIENVKADTVYYGTINPRPKAMFFKMRKNKKKSK